MSEKYKNAYRGYLIDHHSPDPPVVTLEKLDAAEYERFFEEAHINQLMLYCKDHWGSSYYHTEIGRKHPGLKERDWVSEIVPILRRHNIEFTAYYCFEYDSYAPKAHPEWSVRTAEGEPLLCGMPTNSSNARWGIPCLHTGYRSYALEQLREIVSNYHPDSLFIDIFGMTLCYCDTCKEIYRKRFGYELPQTREDMIAHNTDLTTYLDDEAERMLEDVRKTVLEIDPALAITVNFSSHYPKAFRDKLDYMFTEPWAGNWLSGAYARDTAGGKLPQLGPGNVSAVYNYQPDTIYELAAAEIAAQNSRVFMYSESMHYDGTLEMEEAKKVGKAYREVEKFEPYLVNRRVHADIAIIQSDIADTLQVEEPVQIRCVSRALVSGRHRKAILGAMKLCDFSKRTWHIVPEYELDLKKMLQHKMLIFPNLLYISDQLANNLRQYIKRGGQLLLSGECGICDRWGNQLDDFALADLMGCHYTEKNETYKKNNWCAYIRQIDDPIWKYAVQTMPPVGEYTIHTSPGSAKVLGELIDPAVQLTPETWVNWGNPLPGRPNGFAAFYENSYGSGRVLTACFDICTMASENFIWTYNWFLGVVEKYFEPSVLLKTEYVHALEYTVYTRGKELIVHVLSAMARLTGGDTPMLPGGMLQISDTFRKVISAEQVYPVCQPVQLEHKTDIEKTALSLLPLRVHSVYRIVTE